MRAAKKFDREVLGAYLSLDDCPHVLVYGDLSSDNIIVDDENSMVQRYGRNLVFDFFLFFFALSLY